MFESLMKNKISPLSSRWNEACRRCKCLYIETSLDIATSLVYLMISMKVLVVLFLSQAAIVMALDPASYLEVINHLSIWQRLFLHYRLLKRLKTFYPLQLRKRLPYNNDALIVWFGETNELQSMCIHWQYAISEVKFNFLFSKSTRFENDIVKYVNFFKQSLFF